MIDPPCSARSVAGTAARLVAATTVVAALAFPTPGSAQTAVATGTAVYEVSATPMGSLSLCPGESVEILVSIDQTVQRGSTRSSAPVPYAVVYAMVADPSIGGLNTSLISTGGANSGGNFRKVTFTAQGIGQTRIDFTGNFIPNITVPVGSPLGGSVPAAPTSLTVKVECRFAISLYSTWRLPGERQLDVLGVVQSARLVPDAQRNFSTDATMSSSAVWIGGCTGTSRIQRSRVNIAGSVGSTILINLTFDPVSSVTTEGCVGKSKGGQGQAEPLVLALPSQGGTVDLPHVLRTYVNAAGNTTVVLKRLP